MRTTHPRIPWVPGPARGHDIMLGCKGRMNWWRGWIWAERGRRWRGMGQKRKMTTVPMMHGEMTTFPIMPKKGAWRKKGLHVPRCSRRTGGRDWTGRRFLRLRSGVSGTEQPKVQYETGESRFLGHRTKVMPYPFRLRRFHFGKGSRKWGGPRKAAVEEVWFLFRPPLTTSYPKILSIHWRVALVKVVHSVAFLLLQTKVGLYEPELISQLPREC